MLIKKETLQFLKDLERNNNRDWFESNKERFNAANENFIEFTEGLIKEISKFDRSITGLNAKDCVFRIYRDTRFSKDKSPYKINFGTHLICDGKDSGKAGYFFYFQPGASYLGGGIHMPESANLKTIRDEISNNGKALLKIFNDKNFAGLFSLKGEKLAKVPKGFDENDAMGEYLKYKELMIQHPVPDKEIISEEFGYYCSKVFKAAAPLNKFINVGL